MSFIQNPVYVLTILSALVILSIYASRKKWGRKLGAALLVILFGAVLANAGIIPSASNSIPLYTGIFRYIAPLSIFYLLLGVNLNSIRKAGAPMIITAYMASTFKIAPVISRASLEHKNETEDAISFGINDSPPRI